MSVTDSDSPAAKRVKFSEPVFFDRQGFIEIKSTTLPSICLPLSSYPEAWPLIARASQSSDSVLLYANEKPQIEQALADNPNDRLAWLRLARLGGGQVARSLERVNFLSYDMATTKKATFGLWYTPEECIAEAITSIQSKDSPQAKDDDWYSSTSTAELWFYLGALGGLPPNGGRKRPEYGPGARPKDEFCGMREDLDQYYWWDLNSHNCDMSYATLRSEFGERLARVPFEHQDNYDHQSRGSGSLFANSCWEIDCRLVGASRTFLDRMRQPRFFLSFEFPRPDVSAEAAVLKISLASRSSDLGAEPFCFDRLKGMSEGSLTEKEWTKFVERLEKMIDSEEVDTAMYWIADRTVEKARVMRKFRGWVPEGEVWDQRHCFQKALSLGRDDVWWGWYGLGCADGGIVGTKIELSSGGALQSTEDHFSASECFQICLNLKSDFEPAKTAMKIISAREAARTAQASSPKVEDSPKCCRWVPLCLATDLESRKPSARRLLPSSSSPKVIDGFLCKPCNIFGNPDWGGVCSRHLQDPSSVYGTSVTTKFKDIGNADRRDRETVIMAKKREIELEKLLTTYKILDTATVVKRWKELTDKHPSMKRNSSKGKGALLDIEKAEYNLGEGQRWTGVDAIIWALIHGVFHDGSYLSCQSLEALIGEMSLDPARLPAAMLYLSTIDRWNFRELEFLPRWLRESYFLSRSAPIPKLPESPLDVKNVHGGSSTDWNSRLGLHRRVHNLEPIKTPLCLNLPEGEEWRCAICLDEEKNDVVILMDVDPFGVDIRSGQERKEYHEYVQRFTSEKGYAKHQSMDRQGGRGGLSYRSSLSEVFASAREVSRSHAFHRSCLLSYWESRDNVRMCPECRLPLPPWCRLVEAATHAQCTIEGALKELKIDKAMLSVTGNCTMEDEEEDKPGSSHAV